MMYCDKVMTDAFWQNEFGPAAREKGLEKLAITTTALCHKYLGLREMGWCKGADNELLELYMSRLWKTGNFGRKNKAGKVEYVMHSFKTEGIFYRLQKSGEFNWKVLKKHPRLRPFAWIYQAGRYVRQGLKNGKIPEGVLGAEDRAELLKKLEII